MTETLNSIAQGWWAWTLAMFWQVGLLIVVIACIDRCFRRWAWPQLRYALWSLVLVKLLLSPTLSLPGSVAPRLRPLVAQAVNTMVADEPVAPVQAAADPDVHGEGLLLPAMVPSDAGVPTFVPAEPSAADRVAPQAPGPRLNWPVYAMAVWLAGALALGLWLLVKLGGLSRGEVDPACAAGLPQSFHDHIVRCARRLGLRRLPRVVLTGRLTNPAVFGLFRPVLLMPHGYLRTLSRKDAEHLLLHELAHIKRGDLLVHTVTMVLQVVYWYNPLLWLVRRQIHHLRELCCDATVANLLRARTLEYRETLLDTARRFLAVPAEPGLGLLGLFEDANRLLVRLNWLEKETWRYRKMKSAAVIAVVVLMIISVLPMAQATEDAAPGVSAPPAKPAVDSALSEQLQALQEQLRQLDLEKQKLHQQLAALTVAHEAAGQAHADQAAHASVQAHDAHAMVAPAKAHAQEQRQWAEQVRQWQQSKDMQQWQNSEEFKQWQKQMQQWAQSQARATAPGEGGGPPHAVAPMPGPIPAMPPMPAMPAMPVPPQPPVQITVPAATVPVSVSAPAPAKVVMPTGSADAVRVRDVPISTTAPSAGASSPAVSTNGVAVPVAPGAPGPSTGTVIVPSTGTSVMPAPAMPTPTPGDVSGVEAAVDGDYVIKSLRPGMTLQVSNAVGAVHAAGGPGPNCTVKAVIKAKAKTAEEAQALAEKVQIQIIPENKWVRIEAKLPPSTGGADRDAIHVAFHVTVPPEVNMQVDQKVGDIRLAALTGDIKAATEVGAIRTQNLRGNVKLRTNVGNMDIVLPADASAQVRAQTKVGSINSDVPLSVTSAAVVSGGAANSALGSSASGTLGAGEDQLGLTVQVGSIRIRSEASPPEPTDL